MICRGYRPWHARRLRRTKNGTGWPWPPTDDICIRIGVHETVMSHVMSLLCNKCTIVTQGWFSQLLRQIVSATEHTRELLRGAAGKRSFAFKMTWYEHSNFQRTSHEIWPPLRESSLGNSTGLRTQALHNWMDNHGDTIDHRTLQNIANTIKVVRYLVDPHA